MMLGGGVAATLVFALMLASGSSCVDLPGGATVTGVEEGSYTIYHGVPYARRPARWNRSEPIREYQNGERIDGSVYGKQCFQTGKQISPFQSIYLDLNDAGEFEDCLNVTIYSPKPPTTMDDLGADMQLYPVLVWLHGGSFVNGGNAQPNMDMRTVMDENPGMLIAVPNYRLGPLGYFALPPDDDDEEEEEGPGDLVTNRRHQKRSLPPRDLLVEGNQGITDIVSSLLWIQWHIRAFGGDPNRVTAMGHSAGAYAIQFISVILPLSPLYRDISHQQLFHQVVLHSGTVQCLPRRTRADAENEGLQLAKELGCLMGTVKATRACMLAKSADQISAKAANLEWKRIWTPTVGTDFAPIQSPLEALLQGRSTASQLPTLLMTVEDDGSFFIPKPLAEEKLENFAKLVFGFFNQSAAPAIATQYSLAKYGGSFRVAATRILSDMLFHTPARRYAAALAAQGNKRVWVAYNQARYAFVKHLPSILPGLEPYGALHGSDHVLLLAPPVSDPRIPDGLNEVPESRELRRRLVQFVRHGDVILDGGDREDTWAIRGDQVRLSPQDELWAGYEDLPTNNVIALLRLEKLPWPPVTATIATEQQQQGSVEVTPAQKKMRIQ